MKKVIGIVGARPQFIKHATIDLAAKGMFNLVTIHTGQHYDKNMSDIFFDQLNISQPDYMLQTGGYGHGKQTGLMMIEVEKIIQEEKPDALLVYGDTNSTLAGALVAAKLHIPVFHVEAGLRSYNKAMPEEINRILTDHMSHYLFATSEIAVNNLKEEGITERVVDVGDVMQDMIKVAADIVKKRDMGDYIFVTLHRPYNVDTRERLKIILNSLESLSIPVVFAIHPRTRKRMSEFGFKEEEFSNVSFIDPVSYFENIEYLSSSVGLVTDSGGMQKEAYWLKKKCVTIRTETEWVETLEYGWNTLMFDNLDDLEEVLKKPVKKYTELYGDGKAATKIVEIIKHVLTVD